MARLRTSYYGLKKVSLVPGVMRDERVHRAALSCVLFLMSWAPAEIRSRADTSDRFFTNEVIARISIELDSAALSSLRQDSRRYVRSTVTVDTTVYREVGIHLKGGLASFRPLDSKPCLTLKFNKFQPGQNLHGMEKLHLNNSVQDPTFMTELICGELFRQARVPAPRVTHARVALNGRDLGFYVLVEGFDKPFLRRHFGRDDGNLYDGGERTDVMDSLKKVSGHGCDDRSDLKALVAAGSGPQPDRLDQLARVLDLNRFHAFLAMEILMTHWDGYAMARNNYKIYRDPASSRFVFLPHGMDQMFGRPLGSILPDCAGFMAWAVLNTPEGRRRHREACAALFTNVFSLNWCTNEIQYVDGKILPVILEISPGLAKAHDKAVRVLTENIIARLAFLSRELTCPAPQPLAFDTSGVGRLMNWTANLDSGQARFRQAQDPEPSLLIESVGEYAPFAASWRTRVLLQPGKYRFQGRVRSKGLKPPETSAPGGISLHVLDYSTLPSPWAFNDGEEWTELMSDFDVTEHEQEVVLACEVHATKGTVWFAEAGLKLRRFPGPTP